MFSKIKNNPKKTVFFVGLCTYGLYYINNKNKENALRRKLCNEAKQLGDTLIHPLQELTRVTVIHNPIANDRKSSKIFQDNIYPVLNLSGYKVTVVETNKAEEAKQLMSVIKPSDQDCLFVAGGDGTLLEVVTGLLRRADLRTQMNQIPLVLAPLGRSNTFASKWNPPLSNNIIETCNDSVKLIEKNQIKPSNAILIRTIPELQSDQNTSEKSEVSHEPKEIYALSGIEWSIDRDVLEKGKRKWIFGPYRYHMQYVFNGLFGKHLSTNKTATISYEECCSGCSKCVNNGIFEKKNNNLSSKNYLSSIGKIFLPVFFKDVIKIDKEKEMEWNKKSKIFNENCGVIHDKKFVDVKSVTIVLDGDHLKVQIKNKKDNFVEHVKSGIKSLTDIPYGCENECDESFECRQLKIIPESNQTEKFYIDNEELDVVPIEVTVLKDALYFYS